MRTLVPINVPAWGLLIMPVLFILLVGIIILIVINLVNTKQKKTEDKSEENNNNNSKDKTLTSWIKKKDLLYWLLIVTLGTISLFTFRYKDAAEVISHWSFAGTIVSIILAVVAIGFTLFQTLSSNLSSEKIAESAEKIEKATDDLDTEVLLESSKIMNNAALFLEERISLIEESLLSLDTEQKRFNEIAATGFLSNNKNEFNDLLDSQDRYSFENFMNELFPPLPYYSQLFIYAYLRLSVTGIDVDDNIRQELQDLLINYDIKKGYNEDYSTGGLTAIDGATGSIVYGLGLINEFFSNTPDDREKYFEQILEAVRKKNEYFKLIDDYLYEKEQM